MDPLRVADAVELIAGELAALDSSVDWEANASVYADQLRALDAEVVSMLAAVPEERRKLVTNHDAFGYFAERYEFEVVGTVIPGGATLADPSSAELAELVEVLVDENIDVIFAETIEPAALAEAVAAEVDGASVVELFTGSLGESGSGAETYVDFVRSNASRVADALS
jgi:zinc/manganese transport system substrate-binding protein